MIIVYSSKVVSASRKDYFINRRTSVLEFLPGGAVPQVTFTHQRFLFPQAIIRWTLVMTFHQLLYEF